MGSYSGVNVTKLVGSALWSGRVCTGSVCSEADACNVLREMFSQEAPKGRLVRLTGRDDWTRNEMDIEMDFHS